MSALSALIGTSTVIRHVQQLALKVAESDSPVLITGETGSGKEVVARAIHERSARNSGPFVPVKCAAMAEEILEAELFGHAQGAFAGAHGERQGRFELASGGTIFLDEVINLSPRLQQQLMRVLAEGVVQPVGSNRAVAVNVRVICSTHANIDQAVREKYFREDLYYRLASCAVYIPPLRERREDIPALVEHFVNKYNQSKSKSISGVSPDAMSALLQHAWPHNIREIENLIERIVVLKNSGSIEVCDLPPRLRNLVTDNIDAFYEKTRMAAQARPQTAPQAPYQGNKPQQMMRPQQQPYRTPTLGHNAGSFNNEPKMNQAGYSNGYGEPNPNAYNVPATPGGFEENGEIDQFIKKEIDLGNGIDFYRVVEEFENRLIAEALRRTNHNKNRAAQLLSMNRTTLVEKLKKRAASNPVKVESGRVKRNPAFTIFDGLGNEGPKFDAIDFLGDENDTFAE